MTGSVRAAIALECVRGATWDFAFLFDDVEAEVVTTPALDGWSAIMTIDTGERVLEMTPATGHLTIDGPAATVSGTVAAATTLRFPDGGVMSYELRLIEPTGEVRSWVACTITSHPTVRP